MITKRNMGVVGWAMLSMFGVAGCVEYATPQSGGGANLRALSPEARAVLTEPTIQHSLNIKPLAVLPTGIAVARIESPGYRSPTAQGWGRGEFSIVTIRDVEQDSDLTKLAALKQVSGVATVSRLMLPENLQSDEQLRAAAATLHADMLLVYTLDTAVDAEDQVPLLSLLTAGLAPSQKVRAVTTASAVLMDTRTGYIYAEVEATDERNGVAMAWNRESTSNNLWHDAETHAFAKLVNAFVDDWNKNVLKQFEAGPATLPAIQAAK